MKTLIILIAVIQIVFAVLKYKAVIEWSNWVVWLPTEVVGVCAVIAAVFILLNSSPQ